MVKTVLNSIIVIVLRMLNLLILYRQLDVELDNTECWECREYQLANEVHLKI
jgi:hypothetical protein